VDRIDGHFRHAVAHYHLHPDVEARTEDRDPNLVRLSLADGRSASVRVVHGRVALLPCSWHREFGQSIPNQRLSVAFDGRTIETRICW
jgi:hypothetical protein